MARYFDITAVTTVVALDADRKGQASFTVTNATQASIRGDAVVVPQAGADRSWFSVDRPSRRWGPEASDQMAVMISAGAAAEPGIYGFQLRMLLGGGVPEEQFDDSPTVQFSVEAIPEPPPPPPPPPKKPFPWWIVAVVGGVIALLVLGGAVWFFFLREQPLTGDAMRIRSAQPPPGAISSLVPVPFEFTIDYSLESVGSAYIIVWAGDFAGANDCSGTPAKGGTVAYTTIASGTGQVTLGFTRPATASVGTMAPIVEFWSFAGTLVQDFGPARNYCYRYRP